MNPKLTADRLRRRGLVYVRQSSPGQVVHNQESQRRQYGLADHARELGFQDVVVIDEDLGRSGSGLMERPGFQRLVADVCTGRGGRRLLYRSVAPGTERPRLAPLDRIVRHGRAPSSSIPMASTIPALINDRLLLGLKGTMSEFELNLLRQRSLEAIRQKASRGELRILLTGRIVLDVQRSDRARSRPSGATGDSDGLHQDDGAGQRAAGPALVSTGADRIAGVPSGPRRTEPDLEAAGVSQHPRHPDQSDVCRRVRLRQDRSAHADRRRSRPEDRGASQAARRRGWSCFAIITPRTFRGRSMNATKRPLPRTRT